MRASARARVVFVNRYFHPDLSATSQMLSHVAAALAGHGVDVCVVTSRQLYETPRATLRHREVWNGVDVHRIGSTRFGRNAAFGRLLDYLSFHVGVAAWLLRHLRTGDVVVAKTDPPLLSVTAGVVARSRRALLVNWLQDVFPEVAGRLGLDRAAPGRILGLLVAWRDRSLRDAALNVVIGERMRDYLLERGVPATSLRVIENTVDWAAAPPPSASESGLRARLLGDADTMLVSYSGNLGRAHDVDAIEGCLDHIGREEGIRFVLIGGGEGMRRLRGEAGPRGWMHATFMPYQENAQVRDSLAAADVHLVSLLPSMEGLVVPSKAYGVMAAGRPLVFIGDPRGEIARVVQEAKCGVVVPSGDGPALAAVLRKLASNPGERVAMGRRAREAFVARFAPQHVIARWLEALGRVAPGALRWQRTQDRGS